MALKESVQGLLDKFKPRRDEQQPQLVSNRADGGFSGYQPKLPRRKPETQNEVMDTGFFGMMPGGVDANTMQQFQQVGGNTGSMQMPPMPQGQPMQTAGMQPPRPMPRQAGPQPQQTQATGFQPRPQMMGAQQPQRPQFTGFQPRPQMMGAQQPSGFQPRPQQFSTTVQQTPPQQRPQGFQSQQPVQQMQPNEGNITFMPGSFVEQNGSVYRMVLRVAQITGVSSCYRLIEFMQNNEAMIVNAEQITDVMEADRCMDLLFGAAYAMQQNFVRVSGKMIYLITPPQVEVTPFDGLRRMSNDDMERRWPGAARPAYQEPERFGGQPRQDDFSPAFGRHAARRSAQAGAYTDYGGFGVRR